MYLHGKRDQYHRLCCHNDKIISGVKSRKEIWSIFTPLLQADMSTMCGLTAVVAIDIKLQPF